MNVQRTTAEIWASWFRALGDPSRVLILHLLATGKRPITVGDIVDSLDIGQSTVSYHCRILEQAGFVLLDREGTSTRCRINKRCLEMFPTAADVVMGLVPMVDDMAHGCAPWLAAADDAPLQRRPRARRRRPSGKGDGRNRLRSLSR